MDHEQMPEIGSCEEFWAYSTFASKSMVDFIADFLNKNVQEKAGLCQILTSYWQQRFAKHC